MSSAGVRDLLGRPIADLRISVTDRCNLRCPYCMPSDVFGPDHVFLHRAGILSFEEITRVVRILTGLGVRKVRLTGGEPLLRRELAELVQMIAGCGGVDDIALTTNGLLLPQFAADLHRAGLGRVTVSLDALDNAVFRIMSGSKRDVAEVLAGVESALAVGLPVKINCVVRRGINEDQIIPLARYGREIGATVRFIEYMDVGNHNGWESSEVVPSAEVREMIAGIFPLVPVEAARAGETATRYLYADATGEVGFVSSVTEPFCGACNRVRLAADGKIFTCLFALEGFDLRAVLRGGGSDDRLASVLRDIWSARTDRYSELRELVQQSQGQKVEMSYVGG